MNEFLAIFRVDDKTYDIEGILFDKDGTLIELHLLWSHWFEQVWDEILHQQPSITCSKEKVAESIGLDLKKTFISATGPLAIGTMEDITIIVAHHLYVDQLPWNTAVQTVRNSMSEVHSTIDWEQSLQPVLGLKNFLENASKSGVKMGVVTSDDTDIALQHLKILQLDQYFHSILGSEQIDFPKPFAEIGIKSCEEMGIDPKDIVVFGDTNSDMLLGKNLQALASIGVTDNNHGDISYLTDADHVINHYKELRISKK